MNHKRMKLFFSPEKYYFKSDGGGGRRAAAWVAPLDPPLRSTRVNADRAQYFSSLTVVKINKQLSVC